MFSPRTPSLVLVLALAACTGADTGDDGRSSLSADRLRDDIQTLSSDEFGGRGPASPGEERTVAFLENAFRDAGLEGGPDGSFTQDVPLVEITTSGDPLLIAGGDEALALSFGSDWVGWTKRVVPSASIDASELVFVGFGVVAPEYGWDDYAGADVEGKTVVILVNDPGYATQDESVFRGNAMTYYGRWTYKFEEAARQGARAALIVHETGAAGYPWDVVQSSWTGPQFGLAAADNNMGRVEVEGWITGESARAIFTDAGQDFDALVEAAARPGFMAVPLGRSASTAFENQVRRSNSKNVLAVLPGRERPDEVVMYTAHWDHFGTSEEEMDDPVYNGAFDNATGTAGLLELARAFAALPERPLRTIAFLAVTAEEQGLLGSAYYAGNPVYPTRQTVAVLNMDGLNVDGPMRDITVVGYGASELDDYLEAAAADQERILRPDPEPEKGFYYRSDHFSFAKVGVPALYTDSGIDHVEFGPEWTLERRAEYTADRYHKPSDEFDPSWDFEGMISDVALMYVVGHRLATSDHFPNWREGNEFRSIRDRDRGGDRESAGGDGP